MASKKTSGFSLLELMIAISISLILVAVSTLTMQPVWQQQHVNDAYNTTLTALRRAHDQAAADMRVYMVTFSPPVVGTNGGTITVNETSNAGVVLFTATLPMDVTYHIEPGIPTSPTVPPTTPDGFGTASNTFDFDQAPSGVGGSNVIYFYPDGTAEDVNGNINNGVVYMGMPGRLLTCRAITLWGYTGRIRGWEIVKNGTVYSWSQQ
ncbi:MAG: prepilin-type N-terminal cleavage/methylation domain-containing protein [Candidatus Sulfotelmatobacter sp.]